MKPCLRIVLVASILFMILLLSSCDTEHRTIDVELPEVQKYDGGYVHGMEYGVSYDEPMWTFLQEHPYSDAYYGYYWDEDLYWDTYEHPGNGLEIPYIDLYVDERILWCFVYDETEYSGAKAALFEILDTSESPVEEYNGYVFYDCFLDSGSAYPNHFNRVVFNDSQQTVILIGFFHSDHEAIDEKAFTWPEFLEFFYGDWYSFSE